MNVKPVGNPKVTISYEGVVVNDGSDSCLVVVLEIVGIVVFLFVIGVLRW